MSDPFKDVLCKKAIVKYVLGNLDLRTGQALKSVGENISRREIYLNKTF